MLRSALLVTVLVVLSWSVLGAPSYDGTQLGYEPQLAFKFVGSGFHQQFLLNLSLPHASKLHFFDGPPPAAAEGVHTLTVHIALPKAFFFDIAEVMQAHQWELPTDVSSMQPKLKSMTSKHVFDIEAPIFRVPYTHNDVVVTVAVPSEVLRLPLQHLSLLLPIHTRYEETDNERPLDWGEFTQPIPSFRERCVLPTELSATVATVSTGGGPSTQGGAADDGVVVSAPVKSSPACVMFPRGVLAQLPVVYWATMVLLSLGAATVFIVVR